MTESAAASADAARQRRADSLRPDASLRRVEQRPALSCCSPEAGAELFERVDMNGNGGLSLVEIDQAIVDGTIGAALGDSDTLTQPDFAKPVIMRACKAAEVSHDGFIQRAEFMKLLAYLVYFHATYEAFDEIGTDHDRRLTLAEFSSGCARIGLELSSAEAAAEFSRIDTDAGGFVLFGEFCKWAARRHCDSAPVEEQQEAKGASAHPSISADGEDSVHTAQTEETLEHAAGNADIELSAAEQEEIRHKIYSTLLRQAGLNDGDGQPAVSDDPSTKSKAEMLEAHIDLAEACRVQRSWSAAAEAYEEALVIAQSADVALAPEDIAELHNRRGMVLHQFGDDEGAVAAYTAGIAAAAASPRATLYCHRGLSCSRIGQLAAAEKDLRRAVELGGATPDERAVAELAEVSRARRAGVNPASTPTGTAASPNGGSSSNRYSKRRSPTIELPHGITPPAKGSPDSSTAMPASARPSSYGSASKVSPRIRTRVSAQEARTKAQICAATGQSVMPAARGVRLLQEISSIASSFDDVELKALAKAALSEREEATGKWRRELARLRQQSKRQREEIDELKKSKEASVAEAAEAKRQRDERVEAVRSNSEKLLREGRAKQHAAARKRIAEANLNHSAILATALASFRQLVTDVTQEFANATDGSDEYSAAGAGIAMRDELLSRFDLLAAGVEGAVSEQQASLALSPGQATSPGVRESGAPKSSNGSSGAGSVSPVARGDRKDGGSGSAATAVARAKVWHNDSIIGGSQTGLGIYSSDKKLGRPSPSKAKLGPPPPTRTAVLLGLHDGADLPTQETRSSPRTVATAAAAQQRSSVHASAAIDEIEEMSTPISGLERVSVNLAEEQPTTPVIKRGYQAASAGPVVLTTEEQEAATKAVAAREAQWAAAAVQSFSASFASASPPAAEVKKGSGPGELTLEHQLRQFEEAKQRWSQLNEQGPAIDAAGAKRAPQDAERTLETQDDELKRGQQQGSGDDRSKPVRPPRRSNSGNSGDSGGGGSNNNSPQVNSRRNSQRESEAKLLLSHDVEVARQKLRSMSYSSHGQDPHSLLSMYDKDRSGELSWSEFKAAVRKGGKVIASGPHGLSDHQLRKLFSAVDGDHSGAVSINELTKFVWGNGNLLGEQDGTSIGSFAAEHAAPPADDLELPTHGPLALPTEAEQTVAFDRMDVNGNGTLSLAEIDKAVIEIWPAFDHKQALMRAYKAADVSGDGYIGRREFPQLLKYLVYFNNLWKQFGIIDSDHDGRLDAKEMHESAQMLGLDLSWSSTLEDFGQMDCDGGGFVRFDEFCAWCARRMHGGAVETTLPDGSQRDEDEEAEEQEAVEEEEEAEEAGEEVDGGSQYMEIECPEGVLPGDTLAIEVADGQEIDVVVPDGVAPGEVFEILNPNFTGDEHEEGEEGEEGEDGEEEDITVTVTVPQGSSEGDTILIETPSGVEMEVVVPDGCSEGEDFIVTVPR